MIAAAAKLGVGVVNTFVSRDWQKSIEDNWRNSAPYGQALSATPRRPVSKSALKRIARCSSSLDEWPGGKNLDTSPAVWRRMFTDIPSLAWGLNFDPSHLILQHIDYVRCIREFGARIVHVQLPRTNWKLTVRSCTSRACWDWAGRCRNYLASAT